MTSEQLNLRIMYAFHIHLKGRVGSLMMQDTGNSRKRHYIEKSEVVGHLNLPGGRSHKEEEEVSTIAQQ